jgi:hypothetical protein
MKKRLFGLLICGIIAGCGGDYTVTPDFVSNRNQCVPDYRSLDVPVLLDPESVVLGSTETGSASYAQRLVVEKTDWYYSLQMRLIVPNLEPSITAELYQIGISPEAKYESLSSTMPDDSTAGFMTNAEIDTTTIDKAETWMDLVFTEPQQLSVEQAYWALVIPKSTEIAWTTTKGSGFSQLGSSWNVSTSRSATLRAVPCEDR